MAKAIEQRIEALEKRIKSGDCTCDRAENQVRLVVIDSNWPQERDRAEEEASAQGNCPVHPGRRAPVVQLSPSDALA